MLLMDCLHNTSKGWRIAFNLSTLQRIEKWLWSFNPSKDCGGNISNLKDCIHSPSKGWRIKHDPSTHQGMVSAITQLFKGFHRILQPFKGLQIQSFNPSKDYECDTSNLQSIACAIIQTFVELNLQYFEGLKDCMWSFNPSKDCKCDPSTLWRVEVLHVVLQPFKWSKMLFFKVEGFLS